MIQPWVQTFTGRRVSLLDPRPEDIDPTDIAHALSNLCRFTGHCRTFYSVAQHSVLVASLVPPSLKLAALLHDAHEAYLGDQSAPMKHATECGRPYDNLAHRFDIAIANRFGLPWFDLGCSTIKAADWGLLMAEGNQLMINTEGWYFPREVAPFTKIISPKAPKAAYHQFLMNLNGRWSKLRQT